MVKSRKKNSKKRRKTIQSTPLTEGERSTEKILIENFVALQRVMTNLSERFDNLAMQISKLLNLFEISAKALAEKEIGSNKDNKEVKGLTEKIDGLLEQNKTLAKGLLVLHDGISSTNQQKPIPQRIGQEEFVQPPQAFNPIPPIQRNMPQMDGYQKSISSREENQQPPKFKSLLK